MPALCARHDKCRPEILGSDFGEEKVCMMVSMSISLFFIGFFSGRISKMMELDFDRTVISHCHNSIKSFDCDGNCACQCHDNPPPGPGA